MSLVRLIVFCVGLALTVSGCSKPTDPTEFYTAYTNQLNRVSDVLEGVTSSNTAEASISELRKLMSEYETLQEQAKSLPAGGPPGDLAEKVTAALARLNSERERLTAAGIKSDRLTQLLDQLGENNEETLASADAETLVGPETPLEEAWLRFLNADSVVADLVMSNVTDLASAEAILPKLREAVQVRDAAMIATIEAGGTVPPEGVPQKYKKRFAEDFKKNNANNVQLMKLRDAEAIAQLFEPVVMPSKEVIAAVAKSKSPNLELRRKQLQALYGKEKLVEVHFNGKPFGGTTTMDQMRLETVIKGKFLEKRFKPGIRPGEVLFYVLDEDQSLESIAKGLSLQNQEIDKENRILSVFVGNLAEKLVADRESEAEKKTALAVSRLKSDRSTASFHTYEVFSKQLREKAPDKYIEVFLQTPTGGEVGVSDAFSLREKLIEISDSSPESFYRLSDGCIQLLSTKMTLGALEKAIDFGTVVQVERDIRRLTVKVNANQLKNR